MKAFKNINRWNSRVIRNASICSLVKKKIYIIELIALKE